MTEKVNVLSADQYFRKYAVEGIGKGADRWMVRRQLIDAFHKEIFELTAIRTRKFGSDEENHDEIVRITKNVIKDTVKKWIKLCKMFAMYKETKGLLSPDDLKLEEEMGLDHDGKAIETVEEEDGANEE